MSGAGFWWCRHCHRRTELLEAEHGEWGARCGHCRSLKVEFKAAPVPEREATRARPGSWRQHQRVERVSVERAAVLFASMHGATGLEEEKAVEV